MKRNTPAAPCSRKGLVGIRARASLGAPHQAITNSPITRRRGRRGGAPRGEFIAIHANRPLRAPLIHPARGLAHRLERHLGRRRGPSFLVFFSFCIGYCIELAFGYMILLRNITGSV